MLELGTPERASRRVADRVGEEEAARAPRGAHSVLLATLIDRLLLVVLVFFLVGAEVILLVIDLTVLDRAIAGRSCGECE
jgi:hypothetical protein